jgi:hypothetical protein
MHETNCTRRSHWQHVLHLHKRGGFSLAKSKSMHGTEDTRDDPNASLALAACVTFAQERQV